MTFTDTRTGRLRRGLAAGAALALPFALAGCAEDEVPETPNVVEEDVDSEKNGTEDGSNEDQEGSTEDDDY